jgi:hypothetical protein
LTLIHIPLHLYAHFLQPILDLALFSSTRVDAQNGNSYESQHTEIQDHFVSISLTPVECSIVCSTAAAKKLFTPILESLDSKSSDEVVFGEEDHVVIQVDGQGMDPGQRVLDLTIPLALAGM